MRPERQPRHPGGRGSRRRRAIAAAAGLLVGLLAAGCNQNWSPAPVDQALADKGLHPVTALPATRTGPGTAPGHGVAAVTGSRVSLGGLAALLPTRWESVAPAGPMRSAEFRLPGLSGAGPAELAVFRFGPGMGGSTAANVERWVGQFTGDPGTPDPQVRRGESWVHGMRVTRVAVRGTWFQGNASDSRGQSAGSIRTRSPGMPAEGGGSRSLAAESPPTPVA